MQKHFVIIYMFESNLFLWLKVEVYDPIKKVWSQGQAMQCKRSAVGVAALEGRVYICGGYDGVTSLSTVMHFAIYLFRFQHQIRIIFDRLNVTHRKPTHGLQSLP